MRKTSFGLMLITGAISALMTINVFANWTMDHTGYRWRYEDGSYASSTWLWLDGNEDGIAECYCFDANGYMLKSCTTPDGYTVDANGAWTVDGRIVTKSTEPSVDIEDGGSASEAQTATASDAASGTGTASLDHKTEGETVETAADDADASQTVDMAHSEAAQTEAADAQSEGTEASQTDEAAAADAAQPEEALSQSETTEATETVQEIPSERIGILNVRLSGEFAGASVKREDNKLTLMSPDQTKMAVVMSIDLTKDPDYSSVLETAGAYGLDLNTEAMKTLVMDTFEGSFTASMGQQPTSKADKSFATGTWRHLRFDPTAVNGTYSDILIEYDNNIFYTVILGGESGYVDADRFMTENLYIG